MDYLLDRDQVKETPIHTPRDPETYMASASLYLFYNQGCRERTHGVWQERRKKVFWSCLTALLWGIERRRGSTGSRIPPWG